jgi:uncharacterized damage-inducible protein DinB
MDTAHAFVERSRHYLVHEYPAKIQRCLDVLPAAALWRRDDESENSVGNLLLHLAGNVRQWIVAGIGRAEDVRRRGTEFSARTGDDAQTLMQRLRETLADVDVVLARLDAAQLGEARRIQGRDVKVLDAVYHVVEHFSMHTGQIILLTKRYAPGRVQFYEDAGGLAIPRF